MPNWKVRVAERTVDLTRTNNQLKKEIRVRRLVEKDVGKKRKGIKKQNSAIAGAQFGPESSVDEKR